jgi:AcrR family transcriptional regulator
MKPADPDLRDRLLAAAGPLLARFGYRRMTVDDLALAAQVGKGTVYLYFESKQAIALTVIQELVGKVIGRLERIAEGGEPSEERITAMLEARVLGRFDAFAPYADTLAEILSSIRQPLMEQRARQLTREAAILVAVLRQLPGGAAAPAATVRSVARGLVDGTNALLPFYLTREELNDRAELRKRARGVASVLTRGAAATLADRVGVGGSPPL